MKKITAIIICILCLGYLSATAQFLTSTDEKGPWYKIQVKGSNDVRFDRLFEVQEDEEVGQERVFGRYLDDLDPVEQHLRQMFRIEEKENGDYKIIHRSGKEVSIWNWEYIQDEEVKNKDIVIVEPNASTDWTINPMSAGSEYYFIRAMNPGPTGLNSIHQGNSTWNYGYIMEIESSWGSGEDSQFRFFSCGTEFYADVSTVDFGHFKEGSDLDTDPIMEFSIISFGPSMNELELEYTTEDFFVMMYEDEENTSKINFDVYFEAKEPGEYFVPLKIKNKTKEDDISMTVALKAEIQARVPIKPSPSIENSSDDTWYSIYFDQRWGYYMKDMGTDTKIEAHPAIDQNEPSELWKFVSIAGNDTAFKMVSQLGNLARYQVDEVQITQDSVAKVARLYSSSSSDDTFSFLLREDGGYLLQWNEYEEEIEDENTGETTLIPTLTYIIKSNNNKYFNQNTVLTVADSIAGCSVKFFEKGSSEYEKVILPKFSNGEDDFWYYIRFYRVAVTQNYPNEAIYSNGPSNIITQKEVEEEDPFSKWKFVGAWDNFKIVDINGDEFGVTANAETILNNQGDGAPYRLLRHLPTDTWQLECIEDEQRNIRFVNDFQGGHSMKVGGWTANDPGAPVLLTPESQWGWPVGIETPDAKEEDPVVYSIYYTIQGAQLANKPSNPGIYIRKNIHKSKKVSAETIYIIR